MNTHTLIQHPSELNPLQNLPFTRRSTRGPLRLAETFGGKDRASLEKELNRHYYACGCTEGAKGLLLGLFIGTVLSMSAWFRASWSLLDAGTLLLSGAILGAVVGKVIGLLHANMRLRATIRHVKDTWQGSWTEEETIECG